MITTNRGEWPATFVLLFTSSTTASELDHPERKILVVRGWRFYASAVSLWQSPNEVRFEVDADSVMVFRRPT
jgi:hypothetical protein